MKRASRPGRVITPPGAGTPAKGRAFLSRCVAVVEQAQLPKWSVSMCDAAEQVYSLTITCRGTV